MNQNEKINKEDEDEQIQNISETIPSETEVIDAFRNGDPRAVEMASELFGVYQEGCGTSLDGRVKLGKMQADFYVKIGNIEEAKYTLNDILDMLENENTPEARVFFDEISEKLFQLENK